MFSTPLLPPRAAPLRWLAALAIILFFGAPLQAGAVTTCTLANGGLFSVTFPSAISVPRDAPVGTLLATADWTGMNTIYACDITANSVAGIDIRIVGLTQTNVTVQNPANGGGTYKVHATNLPGVGIAFSGQFVVGGCGPQPPAGRVDMTGNGGSRWRTCAGPDNNGRQPYGFNAMTAMLVKTGDIQPGMVSLPGDVLLTRPIMGGADINNPIVSPGPNASFRVNAVAVYVKSCTTSNVTVPLGQSTTKSFKGVGSETPRVKFSVPINNCPAGLQRIGLQFSAPSGVVDANNGVIALSAESTAQGLGLKLVSVSNGKPMAFGAPGYEVAQYAPATGGSYSADFYASYVQTGAAIKPGTANGTLIFTLLYR